MIHNNKVCHNCFKRSISFKFN